MANVGDESLWQSCKADLFAKVDASHERSLATGILRFRDASQIDWLEARITPTAEFLGAASLRALLRLDVDRAFHYLEKLGEYELYLSRSWCFAEFLARDRVRTLQYFHEKLVAHSNPWGFAHVLQGRESLIEPRSLEVLLDALTSILESELARPHEDLKNPNIHPPFDFLLALGDPKLLECLLSRRGQPLEKKLTDWLLRAGRSTRGSALWLSSVGPDFLRSWSTRLKRATATQSSKRSNSPRDAVTPNLLSI